MSLTVPQHACLEVLAQQPGLPDAELALAAFVARHSMNLALRGLPSRGLVAWPASTPHGIASPGQLTRQAGNSFGRAPPSSRPKADAHAALHRGAGPPAP
ncbi:hypothetical protein ACFPN7_25945 [Amycolatopsis halotolerans]|uniref:hypothetical protein n=1 Tax=Amycolatopsis halotolerans TaxID=330083 RepID=UPI0036067CCE